VELIIIKKIVALTKNYVNGNLLTDSLMRQEDCQQAYGSYG